MISVKDIREKEFTKQKHGYNEDEVDDFLDEIADQLEMLVRENRALSQQVDDLKMAATYETPMMQPVAQPVIPEPVMAPAPQVQVAEPIGDEPTYFKNLEMTLRETLISAQRIADDTIAEARKKAKQMVSGAEEQAQSILSSSKAEAESAKAEADEVKKAAEDYRAKFIRLVQEQLRVIKEDEELFL